MARWGTKTRIWETWHKEQYPLTFGVWYNLGKRKYHPYYKHREMDPEIERDFETFLKEVGPRPSKDMTLDRIDNNKGYIKGNLRWADKITQRVNQDSVRMVLGKPASVWEDELGYNKGLIRRRLKYGWSEQEAVWGKTTPSKYCSRSMIEPKTKNGKTTTVLTRSD